MAVFGIIGGIFAYAAGFLGAAAGLSFSTAVAIGNAVGYIASAAVMTALSRALTPRPSIPSTEVKAVINQTDAPRRVYVGRALAGGIRAFYEVKDARLYQLVLANHGQIDAYEDFWIDGEPVALDGFTVISGPAAQYVTVATRDGSGDGGDYVTLLNEFPEIWDENRRLTGQATFLVVATAPDPEDFQNMFPKSYNTTFQWVIRGSRMFDARDLSTAWSDNAALVIAHYLTHADGYRLRGVDVDWSSVSALADWCDLPIPQRAGGSAPNMRLWGYWTLDEAPSQVLDRMAASSHIRAMEMQDGRIGLIGGPFGTPACTLTAKDIAQIQTSEAISEREGYNLLRLSFVSAGHKYEMTEADPWIDSARVAIEGEIPQEYVLEMCPNLSQARRLAKRQMHDDNRARVEIITNLVGLKARYPRAYGQRHTILLDYRPEDGSGRVIQGEYEVMDHEFDPIGLQCRIVLAKIDRASESWDAATEEGDPPSEVTEGAGDPPPELVAVVTQDRVPFGIGNVSIYLVVIRVSAVPIPDRSDLSVLVRYRQTGAADWTTVTSTSNSGFTTITSYVEDGETYEVEARWLGVFAGVAEWVPLGTVTITANTTPPAAPTELIPSPGTGYVHLSWRNPNSGFASVRVYRGATSNLGSAVLIGSTGGAAGQISEYQDHTVSPATDYWYWVRAVNQSGVESDPVGPAAITTA